MSKQLQATPASQWKRTTETRQLPSGKVAELQKPDIAGLVMSAGDGNVPNGLVQTFLDAMTSGKPANGAESARWKPTPEDLPSLMRFVDTIIIAAFANPVIAAEPDYDAGQIAMSDLATEDKLDVFSWAMPEEVAAAVRFRG